MVPTLKALADETRLRIASLLRRFELSVGELSRVLDMGQSRVSRHLKILTDADILGCRPAGLHRLYRTLDHPLIRAITPLLEESLAHISDQTRAREVLTRRAEHQARFFSHLADDWLNLRERVLPEGLLQTWLEPLLPEHLDTLADLGCGTGDHLIWLSQRARRVIGIDNAPGMLDQARNALKRAFPSEEFDLRLGSLEHLPLPDNSLDLALALCSLHHLHAPQNALQEVARVLKPGGFFIWVDLNPHEDKKLLQEHGDIWPGFEPDLCRFWLSQADLCTCEHQVRPGTPPFSLFLLRGQKAPSGAAPALSRKP